MEATLAAKCQAITSKKVALVLANQPADQHNEAWRLDIEDIVAMHITSEVAVV
jgi:hypothetical protein